ncbi:MAG: hypothetical protein LDL41_08950 [Coleofasciculus sp. S288]|nr:hypothetical protein [Coleofasciculus sp. S288]
MTSFTVPKKLSMAATGAVFATLTAVCQAQAATLKPSLASSFSNFYSVTELGSVPQLPPTYAGMTFKPGDPNTLLIGGLSNTFDAGIYAVNVMRGTDNRITGFGSASLFANAPGIQTPGIDQAGVDAGLAYSPQNDVLFYTSYPDNSIGQIKLGSSEPDKQINLGTLGIPVSTGALNFVPKGFAGAGRLKITSYTENIFYDTTIIPDGSGTYDIAAPSKSIKLSGGLDSFNYIKAGNPGFSTDSLLLLEYDDGKIATYAIDDNGDPIKDTRQDFVTGITLPIGSTIDPLTNDLLFSIQTDDAKVFLVSGFTKSASVPEPSITVASLGILGLSLLLKKKVNEAR